MNKNIKLAKFGGQKVRKVAMPSRFSFGRKEKLEINKMINYYRLRGEDPKYSGEWEKKFCKQFSKFMDGGYSDAVATGTGAIFVAMKALEIPKGSDVILSPVTCSGNFSCITEQSLNPVLVDSDINSYNTSLEKIKERITKKTKLIQLTHAGGEPVKDVDSIAKFAKRNKIFLLEDCSQSIGATINGKKVGSFGDIAAFSTMYRKNLAANSSGGVVFTKKLNLYKKILAYGDRGKLLWKKNLDFRNPKYSLFPALNWNTDEFTCAIGLSSLRRLKETNSNRRKFLNNLLLQINHYKIKSCLPLNYHKGYSPFFFPIKYNKNILKISKKKFVDLLINEGIPVAGHYGCVVTDWNWAKKYFKTKFKTENAVETRDNCFHLYLNENYSSKEANDIIKAIKKIENYFLNNNLLKKFK